MYAFAFAIVCFSYHILFLSFAYAFAPLLFPALYTLYLLCNLHVYWLFLSKYSSGGNSSICLCMGMRNAYACVWAPSGVSEHAHMTLAMNRYICKRFFSQTHKHKHRVVFALANSMFHGSNIYVVVCYWFRRALITIQKWFNRAPLAMLNREIDSNHSFCDFFSVLMKNLPFLAQCPWKNKWPNGFNPNESWPRKINKKARFLIPVLFFQLRFVYLKVFRWWYAVIGWATWFERALEFQSLAFGFCVAFYRCRFFLRFSKEGEQQAKEKEMDF